MEITKPYCAIAPSQRAIFEKIQTYYTENVGKELDVIDVMGSRTHCVTIAV